MRLHFDGLQWRLRQFSTCRSFALNTYVDHIHRSQSVRSRNASGISRTLTLKHPVVTNTPVVFI
ncbi:hypothetical protein BDP27DRAFT_1314893 [Rhodocollybia butyracea]|uniref:Uncharacterized protein n=1 Tax=Rhodocollybia butyracea TaxID=206335 RepID=A0A9P5UDN8_9AGAR|nr:hypothetical protein BDP27DRAFT_1314893 [Rhodocollybia butyracea]